MSDSETQKKAKVAAISSGLEMLGAVLVLVGAFALSVWAGVILVGLLLVAVGYTLGGAE